MRIRKCDICKKIIKENHKVIIAGIGWSNKEFCKDCGKPIWSFLLKNSLIKKEEIEKSKNIIKI